MIGVVVVLVAALGAVVGLLGRRVVLSGRYRRPDDDQPRRRLWWAGPAGAAGGALVVGYLDGRSPALVGVALVAAAVLLLLSLVDVDVHRLPDALTRPLAGGLLLADAVAAVVTRTPGPVLAGVGGGAALFAGFYVLALVGSGMGYGDVKLAGAVGCGLGPLGVGPLLAFPVLGLVVGGLGAIALLATGRAGRRSHIALGPALAAGAVLALAFA